MASGEEDDAMDEFVDKFKNQKYHGAFKEDTWEETCGGCPVILVNKAVAYLLPVLQGQRSYKDGTDLFPAMEFDKIPFFLKKAPSEIDPEKNPDLACLQSMLFDEDRPPEEQAKTYKDEGNDYFKEKNYKKAVVSYTEGLNKKSNDQDLNAILYTNRAAAQFYLGNHRSALNDVIAARKLKPNHVKAIIRGALCHLELKHYSEAIVWCDEGLVINAKEKSLLEARARADKLRRAEQRDSRKAQLKEKKEQMQKEVIMKAIQDRKIKLFKEATNAANDDEGTVISDSLDELSLNGLSSENIPGGKVHLDENNSLIWPVLFLYPEYGQTDYIAAFHEQSRFLDHLTVMFGEELPPWDLERKYHADNLELYFKDEETRNIQQINTESTLLQALQHKRYFVKSGTPAFIVFVKKSPFCLNYLSGKKVHRIT